jgi:cell wall-associated NlpC family hydrolase
MAVPVATIAKVALTLGEGAVGLVRGAFGESSSSRSGLPLLIGILVGLLLVVVVVPFTFLLASPQGMAMSLLYDTDGELSTEQEALLQQSEEEVAYYQQVAHDFLSRLRSEYGEEDTDIYEPNWRYFAVVDTVCYQNEPERAKAARAWTDDLLDRAMRVRTEVRTVNVAVEVTDAATGEVTVDYEQRDVSFTIVTHPPLEEFLGDTEVVWEVLGQTYVLTEIEKKQLISTYWQSLLRYTKDVTGGAGSANFTISAQALSDPQFAALMTEATKYIGSAYVWGGSVAPTFDCSGYVSWVLRESGVRDVGRLDAYNLYLNSMPVAFADLKPGDLVFFTNTYDAGVPVTHVGFYVGDDTMLHCGDPIGYADLRNPYWQEHWYSGGRIN